MTCDHCKVGQMRFRGQRSESMVDTGWKMVTVLKCTSCDHEMEFIQRREDVRPERTVR